VVLDLLLFKLVQGRCKISRYGSNEKSGLGRHRKLIGRITSKAFRKSSGSLTITKQNVLSLGLPHTHTQSERDVFTHVHQKQQSNAKKDKPNLQESASPPKQVRELRHQHSRQQQLSQLLSRPSLVYRIAIGTVRFQVQYRIAHAEAYVETCFNAGKHNLKHPVLKCSKTPLC
jgi:hypothetical protein